MTPEQWRDGAAKAAEKGQIDKAIYFSQMGVLEALLQLDTCRHSMRGFCKDCVRNEFASIPERR